MQRERLTVLYVLYVRETIKLKDEFSRDAAEKLYDSHHISFMETK